MRVQVRKVCLLDIASLKKIEGSPLLWLLPLALGDPHACNSSSDTTVAMGCCGKMPENFFKIASHNAESIGTSQTKLVEYKDYL